MAHSQQHSGGGFLLGRSYQNHAYRVIESTKFAAQLHPLIDFIIYDPSENDGKLLSERITEGVLCEIVKRQTSHLGDEENFQSSGDGTRSSPASNKQSDPGADDDSSFIIHIPLEVYSIVDRQVETKHIEIDVTKNEKLMLISDLIAKIEAAKQVN